jgi:Fic family protein
MTSTYPLNMSINPEIVAMSNPDWRPDQPYNQIPLLPPPVDLETTQILKQCILARCAVAGLNASAELIPNQEVLTQTLPILEAQASSEIENIVTTTDKLFKYQEIKGSMDPATKEAFRYRMALLEGFKTLSDRPLTTGTAEKICSTLKGVSMKVRQVPGTTLTNDRTKEVIYTPPVGEDHLRSLLANWEKFLHGNEGLDPLIRMAVLHYQFEAIHPFTDGNGRTGRVINSLFMIEAKLLSRPILHLSRYIMRYRSDYYSLLLGVTREQAWEPWILYILKGVEETANWTSNKIHAMKELMGVTTKHCKHSLEKKTYSKELVELLFEQPYCRIQNLVDAGVAKRQTASIYLKELARVGVLEERTEGRENLYLHTKLLKLLTQESNDFDPYSDVNKSE